MVMSHMNMYIYTYTHSTWTVACQINMYVYMYTYILTWWGGVSLLSSTARTLTESCHLCICINIHIHTSGMGRRSFSELHRSPAVLTSGSSSEEV